MRPRVLEIRPSARTPLSASEFRWQHELTGSVLSAMRHTALAILLVLPTITPGHAQQRPSLVPGGWTQVSIDPQNKTRRFASPDGRSWLMAKQSIARVSALDRDMQDLAGRAGETVTYQRRGASWIAVSGYRDARLQGHALASYRTAISAQREETHGCHSHRNRAGHDALS